MKKIIFSLILFLLLCFSGISFAENLLVKGSQLRQGYDKNGYTVYMQILNLKRYDLQIKIKEIRNIIPESSNHAGITMIYGTHGIRVSTSPKKIRSHNSTYSDTANEIKVGNIVKLENCITYHDWEIALRETINRAGKSHIIENDGDQVPVIWLDAEGGWQE